MGIYNSSKAYLKKHLRFYDDIKQLLSNYLTHEKFQLANVTNFTKKGSSIAKGVMEYINEQYDPAMSWKDAEYCSQKMGRTFCS